MSGFQHPGFQSPGFQGEPIPPASGFIPRGSTAMLAVPALASAGVAVPRYSATVTVPASATAEVE